MRSHTKRCAAGFFLLLTLLTMMPFSIFAQETEVEIAEVITEASENIEEVEEKHCEEENEAQEDPPYPEKTPSTEVYLEDESEEELLVEGEDLDTEESEIEVDPEKIQEIFSEDLDLPAELEQDTDIEDPVLKEAEETENTEDSTKEEVPDEEEGTEEEDSTEEEVLEEEKQEILFTVCLLDVRDSIRIRRNGVEIAAVYGNPSPGIGHFFLVGSSGLEELFPEGDGRTRLRFPGETGDVFEIEVSQPVYATIWYEAEGEWTSVAQNGVSTFVLCADKDTEVSVNGDYSGAVGFYALPSVKRRLLAASSNWTLPNALYVSLGQAYDTYSSNAVVNGHRGVYFFQPEELGTGKFVSATCGSTTKSMVSGTHYKTARVAELSARTYLDYGSGCCSQRAQRALAWITHHGQSEYDWNRANGNGFIMGDGKLSVANQLEAYTITFLAAWCCTNDGRQGSYGTVHAEDGAHALDFMFGSGFSTGLPASTKSAIDRMVAWGLAFADAHPDQDENVDEYQQTFVYSDGNGAHQPLLVGAYQGKVKKATVSVVKSSSVPECTNNNAMYSFAGTQFSVKDSTGKVVGTLTANANGTTNKLELDAGTYTVTETKAGTGYLLNTESQTITLKEGEDITLKFANEPLKDPVVLRIIKIDGEGNSKDPQGEGSLKGARYRFDYYDNLTWSGDPERSWIFETDTGGEILYAPQYKVEGPDLYLFDGSNYLPLGSLKITEVEPPLGYTLETKEILFTITGNGSNVETVLSNESGSWISATPDGFLVPEKVIRGGVRFKKVDREAGLPVAGAEIAIYSASEQPVLVDGVSYEKDDCVLTLTTKENGKAETSANALPFGTYYAKETKASEGYVRNEEWKLEFRVTEDGKILDLTTGGNLLEEQIVRGDLRFRKVDEDGIPMAKVPFLLIRTDENGEEMESHVLFTDKSGILDTSRNRLGEINSLDDYAQFGIYEGPATEQEECGVWFGDGTPEEGLGALPYGTYKLVELLTDDLYERGMDLLKVEDIRIQSHGTVVELGDLVDHEVRLSTRARSGYGDFFLSNEDDHSLTVTDTIHYENLTPGRRYRIETQFVSKEDPSHVLAEGEVTFVAPLPQDGQTRSMGEVTVETQITEEIRDTAIVAVDTLYGEVGENEVVLAEHRDLGNLAQTLWLPEIFTHAYEPGTHMDEVQASANSTVEDTVMYSGLKPGVSYTVIGVLMDKETGEALTEKGYAITSVLQFTPEEESGSVTLSFPFDSTNLIGKTVVAFESLLYEGRIIAVHADLQDEDQSVHVLQIGTQAKDEKTGTHEAQLSREEVLTDTVQYQGLTPGRLYCLRGTIMVKSTGNPLTKDGLQITGIRWFEANTPDGEVEISFTVDTEEVQGQDLVVFEELYLGEEMQGLIPEDEIPIAVHKDLQDEGQTIHVPVRPPQYVNTGDSSRIQLWACTGILAGELLLAALWLRFRRKKENRRASRDE